MCVNLRVLKSSLFLKVFQPEGTGFCRGLSVLLVLLSFSLVGCFNPELEKAFSGGLVPEKSNQIISDYCQSCHIHRELDVDKHVLEVREQYQRPLFRKSNQCRSCHYIEKQWIHNQFTRKTRRPEDANRGRYREFEKKFKNE